MVVLTNLVRELMPAVTESEIRHFILMVGRRRLPVTKPVLKAHTISALETII
jgi:hypothetical protein